MGLKVLAAGSLSFAIGSGTSFSFDLAFDFPVDTFFKGGAASALASVSARARFDRGMMVRDASQSEERHRQRTTNDEVEDRQDAWYFSSAKARDRVLACSLCAENKGIVQLCSKICTITAKGCIRTQIATLFHLSWVVWCNGST